MGIIMQRRRRRRAALVGKSMLLCAVAAGIAALLILSERVQNSISGFAGSIQAFSENTQMEMTLPAYDVYALQLAVFDSGERAVSRAQQLQSEGVRCVIWQREKMRIVVSAAFSRDSLDSGAAKGHEAYVIRDSLPEVSLRLSAQADDAQRAQSLLETPDAVLHALLEEERRLEETIGQTRTIAERELEAHPENTIYTQLAKSLINWCDLMENTLQEVDEAGARSYGAVTMCTLCRELRQALSTQSTASAQRTPSTAADVMPPA